MKTPLFFPQNTMRRLALKGTACIGAVSSILIPPFNTLPAHGQDSYIAKLADHIYVVATANMDTNNPTIVTLEERLEFECAQASGVPSRFQECVDRIRAEGMTRTVYEVDCNNLTVSGTNRNVTNNIHEIDPVYGPSRATYQSYLVFDYACGTNYANR